MEKLAIGQKGRFHKTISESDIYLFAGISGDLNRFHVDEVFAQKTFFKHRIAHGVLLLSFVSAALGTDVPGAGTVIMSMSSEFLKPAYIGDTVIAETEIVKMEKNKLEMAFVCLNQKDEILVNGRANVTVPKDRV